uniref:3-dehydrosphinganine reductase TSC10A-like isoform X1 n=1 Tax=Rhizophora mucronata TaxID=61149 RepID=A0A2P2JX00_RHIMU
MVPALSAAALTASKSLTSVAKTATSIPEESRIDCLASSSDRARMETRAPSAAARRARASPMPLDPPVMNT